MMGVMASAVGAGVCRMAHCADSRSTSECCEPKDRKTSYESGAHHEGSAKKPEHHQCRTCLGKFGVPRVVRPCLITFETLQRTAERYFPE